ncbi:MAG: 5'-nucleotidase [bacterium]|nr:5'-nucleotidase [bacterium]
MKNKIFLLFLVVISACGTSYQVKEQQNQNRGIKGDSSLASDETVIDLIKPYKLALDSLMNIHVIDASTDLKKAQPEGSLGNMVCDVFMEYAKNNKLQADFCVLNNGGLRIPVLYKGPIAVRTVFELLPFDNQVVLVKVRGQKCLELFNVLAQNNGAPVAGLNMDIENDLATNIKIMGVPFDVAKDYWILTSDYLANGGDKAEALLNPLERIDTQKLMRDALIEQLKIMNSRGQNLNAVKDGRISKK